MKRKSTKAQPVIVEKRLGIPGDYQFSAISSKNPLQAHWHQNKLAAISHCLKLNKNSVVLDLGAGSGNFELHFGTQLKKIISADYNDESIAFLKTQLKQRGISSVQTLQVNITDTAKLKKLRNLDAIIMIDVIEHIERGAMLQTAKAFHEMLKPGGQVCIITPNYGSIWPLIEKTSDALHLLPQFDGEQHISKFTATSLREFFQKTKLRLVAERSFNLFSFLAPSSALSKKLCLFELDHLGTAGSLMLSVFEKRK